MRSYVHRRRRANNVAAGRPAPPARVVVTLNITANNDIARIQPNLTGKLCRYRFVAGENFHSPILLASQRFQRRRGTLRRSKKRYIPVTPGSSIRR